MELYPIDWEIYEATDAHRPRRIATFPKSASVWLEATHEAYCFFNRVDVLRNGHLVVETVALAPSSDQCGSESVKQPVPSRLGERHEYEYVSWRRRFVETR